MEGSKEKTSKPPEILQDTCTVFRTSEIERVSYIEDKKWTILFFKSGTRCTRWNSNPADYAQIVDAAMDKKSSWFYSMPGGPEGEREFAGVLALFGNATKSPDATS